jgi:putative tryptophan/tyrosine transport system substrate-binding protein
MKRRKFITLLGGAAAWPIAARAQPSGGMPSVGYLTLGQPGSTPEEQARHAALRQALEKLGWTEGRNIRIDFRWGGTGSDRLRASAAELVDSAPNVILAVGTPILEALRRETRVIPIVFVGVSDPFGGDLVDNMARPGGNLTGFANYPFSIGGKWLQTLKEVAPAVKRVLVVLLPGDIAHQGFLRVIETAARTLDVETVEGAARDGRDIERAIDAFAQEPNGGLLVLPGLPGRDNGDLIIGLAARHRLPGMYTYRFFVPSGGLMSYDTDTVDLVRRSASYIDRILKGEKPGDLPVQLPTKYDLVINLKTAKSLGLAVPPSLLASADEVIE